MKNLRFILVASSLLASCSGGGGTSLPTSQPISSSPANPSAPSAQKHAAAAFTIVIPKATAASVKRRQYISAATQSLVVTLTTVNGTPVSLPQAYAVNLGGSGCPLTGGVTTCTLMVPATAGNDVFSIVTYNAAQSSTTPTTLTGNRLSMQTTTVSIAANTANVSVPLALDGVVASLGVTIATPAYYWHPSQTIPISIQPRDAAGDLIVAPGGYRDTNGNPLTITLADSDTSGSTSLPTTSFATTSAAANASLSFTGGALPVGVVITASAGSLTHTVSFVPVVKSGTIFVGTSNGTQVYDHSGTSSPTLLATVGSGTAHGVVLCGCGTLLYQSIESTGHLNVYHTGATTTPEQTVNGFTSPEELAVDPSTARVFVAQATNGPAYVNPGAVAITGTAAQPTSAYGANYGVAVSSAGLLYALDYSNGNIWSYSSNLAVAPTSLTSGYNSKSLSFESNGKLLVSNNSGTLYALTVSTLAQSTVASGLATVYGATSDSAGNVFISLGDSVDEVPIATGTLTILITSTGAGFFQIAVAP